jgi:hypothetical protein
MLHVRLLPSRTLYVNTVLISRVYIRIYIYIYIPPPSVMYSKLQFRTKQYRFAQCVPTTHYGMLNVSGLLIVLWPLCTLNCIDLVSPKEVFSPSIVGSSQRLGKKVSQMFN